MTTATKILQLQSSQQGGLVGVKQFSVGKTFDPNLCRDLLTSPSVVLERSLLKHIEIRGHPELINSERKMTLERMRASLRAQAVEKTAMSIAVSCNSIALESFESVTVLGEKELDHRKSEIERDRDREGEKNNVGRGGVSTNGRGVTTGVVVTDPTFMTRGEEKESDEKGGEEDRERRRESTTSSSSSKTADAPEMRAMLKEERHRLRECFVSAFTHRLRARDEVMETYQRKSDAIVSKHHQRSAAADEQAAGKLGSGSKRKSGGQRHKMKKKEEVAAGGAVAAQVNMTTRSTELELELLVLKSETLRDVWAKGVLLIYRKFSVRPQVVQTYRTIQSLVAPIMRHRKRARETKIFSISSSKFGSEMGDDELVFSGGEDDENDKNDNGGYKSLTGIFTTSSTNGSLRNPFHLPNWYDIHRVLSMMDDDGSQEEEVGACHMHTMLRHGQILKKLIQALLVRCRLLACGTSGFAGGYGNKNGTSARMVAARETKRRRGEDEGNMEEQDTAAMDALSHELDKLHVSVRRVQEAGGGGSGGGGYTEEKIDVLSFLHVRASVEVSKLRASFKYVHDQVTGVCKEETMPRHVKEKQYRTTSEKEREAEDAGISLADWLEVEALSSDAQRVRGLHQRLLRACRGAMFDLDEEHVGIGRRRCGGQASDGGGSGGRDHALQVMDGDHLSLAADGKGGDGTCLDGSSGYDDVILRELRTVGQHVAHGHAAAAGGANNDKDERNRDGGVEDQDDDDDNENKRKRAAALRKKKQHRKMWSVAGSGTPWRWMQCSEDVSRDYRKMMSSIDRSVRIRAWGPFVGLQLPTSLSPWFARLTKRFDLFLAPTARNYVGASLQMIELKVEGASLVCSNAVRSLQSEEKKRNGRGSGSNQGIATGTKRWRDLPEYDRSTRNISAGQIRPMVDAEIQHEYLERESKLRSHKLALLELYQLELETASSPPPLLPPTVTLRVSEKMLEKYAQRVERGIHETLGRLRMGRDPSALQQV